MFNHGRSEGYREIIDQICMKTIVPLEENS